MKNNFMIMKRLKLLLKKKIYMFHIDLMTQRISVTARLTNSSNIRGIPIKPPLCIMIGQSLPSMILVPLAIILERDS